MSTDKFLEIARSNPIVHASMHVAEKAGMSYETQLEMAIVGLDAAYQETRRRYAEERHAYLRMTATPKTAL